jgi:hypothetical protein
MASGLAEVLRFSLEKQRENTANEIRINLIEDVINAPPNNSYGLWQAGEWEAPDE